MSLILEALRKMEQERRNRKASTGIRAEVLRYRAAVSEPQARPYLLPALAVLLVAAGLGAGWLLKGGWGTQPAPAIQATEASRTAHAASPAQEAQPPAPAAPVPPPATAPAEPARPAAPLSAESPGPARPDAAVPAQAGPAAPKASRKAVAAAPRDPRAEGAVAPQGEPHREAPQELPAPLPDITISGIAYQDERHLRRAVLNGALVGEGAEVAGARVVEIRENKVRMSRGGRIFEVLFSSGLQSR